MAGGMIRSTGMPSYFPCIAWLLVVFIHSTSSYVPCSAVCREESHLRLANGAGPPPLLLLRLRGGKPKRGRGGGGRGGGGRGGGGRGGGSVMGFNDLGSLRKLEAKLGGKEKANQNLKALHMDDLWEGLDDLIDGFGIFSIPSICINFLDARP